jgi:ATP-dependent Clp protease ATP-binding subunit ClpA
MTTPIEFAPPNYENPFYETIPESVKNLLGTAGSASMVRLPEEVPAQNPELRSFLEDHIVGQRPAIEAIVQAVSRVNVRTDDRPIASMEL